MGLKDFISMLIDEKFREHPLEDYQRRDLESDLLGRLETYISLKVMTELAEKNPKLLSQFQSLASGNTPAPQIQQFIEANIPDGPSFLAKVLDDFRILYLGLNKS